MINHPEYGIMLNQMESAKYLGISRKKFRRIAPPPDYVHENVFSFWSRRLLDILDLTDDSVQDAFQRGKNCGNYLIGDLDEQGIQQLKLDLSRTEMDCGIRRHTCGFTEMTKNMSELERAEWCRGNCYCSKRTRIENTSFVLEQYGIKINGLAHSLSQAQAFRDGIRSAINEHFRRQELQSSTMAGQHGDARRAPSDELTVAGSASEEATSEAVGAVKRVIEWQRLCPIMYEYSDKMLFEWLAYYMGQLIGRVSETYDGKWDANFEGELSCTVWRPGLFPNLKEAQRALERAAAPFLESWE